MANNSSWVPCSLTCPYSKKKITSESSIVLNLWATVTEVLPFCNSFILFWTSISLSLSKAEVASSNNKIQGSFKNVLAIANLCFSPPETGASFSPFCLFLKNLLIDALSAALNYHIKYFQKHFV